MRSAHATTLGAIALSIPAWWLALFVAPAVRTLFVSPEDWDAFQSLLAPDLALAAVTLAAAVASSRRQLQLLLVGIATGGWGYATLWTIASAWRERLPALDAVAMVAGLVVVSYTCHAVISQSAPGAD